MAQEVKLWTPESAAEAVSACVWKDDQGYTWYSARAFMDVVGYFPAIERAQFLYVKAGLRVDDHFRRTFQELDRGVRGAKQFQSDIEMSRDGFNRLIQSVDPRKSVAQEIKNAVANLLAAVQDRRLVPATELGMRPNLPWSTRFKLYHKDHIGFYPPEPPRLLQCVISCHRPDLYH